MLSELLSLGHGLVHSGFHLLQPSEIVLGVSLSPEWVEDHQRADDPAVRTHDLLEREVEVEKRLFADDRVKLPFHNVG